MGLSSTATSHSALICSLILTKTGILTWVGGLAGKKLQGAISQGVGAYLVIAKVVDILNGVSLLTEKTLKSKCSNMHGKISKVEFIIYTRFYDKKKNLNKKK